MLSIRDKGIVENRLLSGALGLFVGLAPAIGEAAVVLILLIGVVTLPFLSKGLSKLALIASFPVFAYSFCMAALNLFHMGSALFSTDLAMYLGQLVIAALAVNLFYAPSFHVNTALGAAALGLALSIGILAADYYSVWNGLDCRAMAFSGNAQWVSGFMTLLFFSLLASDRFEKVIGPLAALVLHVAVLVAIGTFAGTRMAFYTGLIISLGFVLARAAQQQFLRSFGLLAALLLGVLCSFAVDRYSHCNFSNRAFAQFGYFSQVLDYVYNPNSDVAAEIDRTLSKPLDSVANTATEASPSQPSPPPDNSAAPPAPQVNPDDVKQIIFSGASRVAMWQNALDAFVERPILGHGQAAEKDITTRNLGSLPYLIHVHNQFLSWLIWGGLVGLAIGLLLIFGIFMTPVPAMTALAFSATASLLFLSESYLALQFNVNIFIVLLLFIIRSGHVGRSDPSA